MSVKQVSADRLPRHDGPVREYEKLFIGGEWTAPLDGGVLDSIDPATGKVWARVAYGGARDIDRAVTAARAAFEGPWGRMPGWERAALLTRLADLYQKHASELAILESRPLDCLLTRSLARGVPVLAKGKTAGYMDSRIQHAD